MKTEEITEDFIKDLLIEFMKTLELTVNSIQSNELPCGTISWVARFDENIYQIACFDLYGFILHNQLNYFINVLSVRFGILHGDTLKDDVSKAAKEWLQDIARTVKITWGMQHNIAIEDVDEAIRGARKG